MRNNFIKKTILVLCVFQIMFFGSCKKFVEIEAPENQVSDVNVYTSDATAIAVLTGLYTRIAQGTPSPNFVSGTRSLSLLCGLSADEYTLFTGANAEMTGFYRNALVSNLTTSIGTAYWEVLYDYIYYANSAIEGLSGSKSLTEAIKKQLLGEAKFMRAFFYFYLVNLYGDVSLITSTDYKKNATQARVAKEEVYQQIITDLRDAEGLLSTEYLDGKLQNYIGTIERVRPTKWAAKALLARVYLYNGNITGDVASYANAESQATDVINNTALYDTVAINNVFLRTSKEAIWQLQTVKSNQNTDDSKMFIITTGFSNSIPVRLSDTLLNSFETNDLRKISGNWVKAVTLSGNTYYYPYKYKNNTATVTEYLMVFRLAELYLIRSEARAQQNKISEAQADLNVIRKRAKLDNTTASDKNSLLSAILHERQIEFFSEWGHRWFDLKRTNNINAVMDIITPKKANGSQWQSYQKFYPIPFTELQRDPNLIQTDGYQ